MNNIIQKEKIIYQLLITYLREKDNFDREQLERIQENFLKEIEKQDTRMERFHLELEHPELFKQLSPKEYGQKSLKRKR